MTHESPDAAPNHPKNPVGGKTVAEILGEITWLMTQDPVGREMKVTEIEALVMPAILARRFHIKHAQVPDIRRPGATTLQPVEVRIFEKQMPEETEKPFPVVLAEYSALKGKHDLAALQSTKWI
ncbi:toxin-activating lysine-acyltransferase [Paenirhodobacter sp.]|uniref:toxin-activating lysine-acyltransferase n=1 Tax=Paenirhodobacter sp. TaxID=1965326 RepID=UPI003B3BF27E